MRAYLLFELRRLAREPRLMLFAVVTPVVSYIIFSGVGLAGYDPETERAVATALMIGIGGYGAVIGVLSVGVSVSVERSLGWLRQLRATPLPPSRVVVVKTALSTLTAIPPVACVGLAGWLQHGIALSPGRWAAIIVVMWLGSIPFAVLGLAVGYGLPPQIAQPVSFLLFFGLSVLGGLLVPVAAFPSALQHLALVLPTYRYAELGWQASTGLFPSAGGLAILAGWTALFAVGAAYAYRRFASVR